MEKDEKAGKTRLDRARSRGSEPSKSASSYADGASLDRVQYLEAKLILKPDRFKSVESFRDFGKSRGE